MEAAKKLQRCSCPKEADVAFLSGRSPHKLWSKLQGHFVNFSYLLSMPELVTQGHGRISLS